MAHPAGLISAAAEKSVGPVASAMRVFHTWIGDEDRKLDHVQVDMDSPDNQLSVSFIDHAYSMSKAWKGPNCPGKASPKYLPCPEHVDIMREVAGQIARLDNEEVQRIINRIPPGYLPSEAAGHIISNLIGLSGQLCALLAIPSGER